MREASVHFLLPFSLPPAAMGAALQASQATPALDAMLARAQRVEQRPGADYQRGLPHELWLARTYGLIEAETAETAEDADAPLAPYMLLADGGSPDDLRWSCILPAHVQVAHDHLLLLDPRKLALADGDSLALQAAARETFEARGMRFEAPTSLRWYIGEPAAVAPAPGPFLGTVQGASPWRAAGRSIDLWLPTLRQDGAAPGRSRAWMVLQNEVQMAWHEHPVNEARESRRELPVNTVWLHGQGRIQPGRLARPFDTVAATDPAARGLALASGAQALPVAWFNPVGSATLVVLDALSEPYLDQDWYRWLEALHEIDSTWLAPALSALKTAQLSAIYLTLFGDTGGVTLKLSRFDLKKFWRHGSLRSLLFD